MSNRAAIRYAKAVLEHASESNLENVIFGDMQSVYKTIQGSKELRNVLKSPVVKAEDKKAALVKIFENNSEVTKGLIEVLTANKRIDLLGNVAESFIDLYNEAKGVKVANVTTAVELTPELEELVLSKVKELTGSNQVTIQNKVDKDIIGGFILRVGDLQYDSSIANQFENIKREFSKSI
ncbi:ATP synthase F1 subunit delta [Ulvibacter antarcticus]|uniref:ATP synthase subunit delta n=1 Tax=Ulvibacter antarcticus TaxID=442714 RepID=A0A3L9ZGV2_9FLAO|nr:ATP synthase F1 subunit delta [Ulvibacter antarcticus]RMA65952.1 ATP synthase F1 subcomplex delta subunit [Ulvibacter antarcticus]